MHPNKNPSTHPEPRRPVPRHCLYERLHPDIVTYQILVAREEQDGDLREDPRENGDGGVCVAFPECLVYGPAAFDPGAGMGFGVEGADDVRALA